MYINDFLLSILGWLEGSVSHEFTESASEG